MTHYSHHSYNNNNNRRVDHHQSRGSYSSNANYTQHSRSNHEMYLLTPLIPLSVMPDIPIHDSRRGNQMSNDPDSDPQYADNDKKADKEQNQVSQDPLLPHRFLLKNPSANVDFVKLHMNLGRHGLWRVSEKRISRQYDCCSCLLRIVMPQIETLVSDEELLSQLLYGTSFANVQNQQAVNSLASLLNATSTSNSTASVLSSTPVQEFNNLHSRALNQLLRSHPEFGSYILSAQKVRQILHFGESEIYFLVKGSDKLERYFADIQKYLQRDDVSEKLRELNQKVIERETEELKSLMEMISNQQIADNKKQKKTAPLSTAPGGDADPSVVPIPNAVNEDLLFEFDSVDSMDSNTENTREYCLTLQSGEIRSVSTEDRLSHDQLRNSQKTDSNSNGKKHRSPLRKFLSSVKVTPYYWYPMDPIPIPQLPDHLYMQGSRIQQALKHIGGPHRTARPLHVKKMRECLNSANMIPLVTTIGGTFVGGYRTVIRMPQNTLWIPQGDAVKDFVLISSRFINKKYSEQHAFFLLTQYFLSTFLYLNHNFDTFGMKNKDAPKKYERSRSRSRSPAPKKRSFGSSRFLVSKPTNDGNTSRDSHQEERKPSRARSNERRQTPPSRPPPSHRNDSSRSSQNSDRKRKRDELSDQSRPSTSRSSFGTSRFVVRPSSSSSSSPPKKRQSTQSSNHYRESSKDRTRSPPSRSTYHHEAPDKGREDPHRDSYQEPRKSAHHTSSRYSPQRKRDDTSSSRYSSTDQFTSKSRPRSSQRKDPFRVLRSPPEHERSTRKRLRSPSPEFRTEKRRSLRDEQQYERGSRSRDRRSSMSHYDRSRPSTSSSSSSKSGRESSNDRRQSESSSRSREGHPPSSGDSRPSTSSSSSSKASSNDRRPSENSSRSRPSSSDTHTRPSTSSSRSSKSGQASSNDKIQSENSSGSREGRPPSSGDSRPNTSSSTSSRSSTPPNTAPKQLTFSLRESDTSRLHRNRVEHERRNKNSATNVQHTATSSSSENLSNTDDWRSNARIMRFKGATSSTTKEDVKSHFGYFGAMPSKSIRKIGQRRLSQNRPDEPVTVEVLFETPELRVKAEEYCKHEKPNGWTPIPRGGTVSQNQPRRFESTRVNTTTSNSTSRHDPIKREDSPQPEENNHHDASSSLNLFL